MVFLFSVVVFCLYIYICFFGFYCVLLPVFFLHIVDVGSFLSLGSWSRGFSVGVSLLFF